MGSWSTHAVVLGSVGVTKRFRGADRERGGREWRALELLARYAPGPAPEGPAGLPGRVGAPARGNGR